MTDTTTETDERNRDVTEMSDDDLRLLWSAVKAEVRRRSGRKLLIPGASYAVRTLNLRKLGFKTYQAYLTSDLWQGIRKQVFARRKDCQVCCNPATDVHHRSYDLRTMKGETIRWLVPLCRDCHYRIEYNNNGQSRGMLRVEGMLNNLCHGTLDQPLKQSTPPKKKGRKSQRKTCKASGCLKHAKKAGYCRVHARDPLKI